MSAVAHLFCIQLALLMLQCALLGQDMTCRPLRTAGLAGDEARSAAQSSPGSPAASPNMSSRLIAKRTSWQSLLR